MNIVVTGSRKGIGRHLAEHYLSQGHTVFGCSREPSDLASPNYTHLQCDVTDEASVTAFAQEVRQQVKHIDALVNNAGAASMNHFMLTPPASARRLMEINYMGSFQVTRAFVNLLKKAEHPRIVNFTTIAVPLVLEGEAAYQASKSAVEALTRILSKELASFRITVNAVGPSAIATDLIAKVPKEKVELILQKQTVHKLANFTDLSNVVDFYISPASDFVTGQVLYLGGVN
jgi:3-oxoacyl-[acyl-carrier protein] reductase